MSNLATITNNILADSGIDDINVVVSTGSYADPSWITSLAWTKITGTPTIVGSVTASSPLFSSGGTSPNLTIQQASGSQNGFLSSTDWTTFNNKQAALTNPVTGTGTAGQVAYFTGTTAITGENNLFWDATNNRLDVIGTSYISVGAGIGVTANFINSGPILTATLTNGGSGYVDATYTDVAATAISTTSGVYALFTIVVSGGIVTTATLTWGGTAYRVGDTLTVSNTLLGGTGSGLVITVATVDSSELIIADSIGGDITLYRNDTSLAANDNIGSIKFEGRDSSSKASGVYAKIGAGAAGTGGGAYLSFLTASGSGGALTERLRLTSGGTVIFSNLGGVGTRMVVADANGLLSTQAITVGTVTSVAALTLGTTGTDLTSTVANGTTTPVITLNVPNASATNRGVLTAADWTTFNNKTSNTGTVTSVGGTGTVNGLTLTGTVTTTGNLTLGGTLAIDATQITSGTLPITRGGTGATTTIQGGVVYGASTSAYATTAASTSGYVLTSGGTGAPSFLVNDLTLFPSSNFKKSVKAATTANITLSAPQTIDGISCVAGDRVLVKNQTTASQNGIYVVNAAAWTRPVDADASDEIASAVVAVDQGTVNGGTLFTNYFKATDVVGTTAMPWYNVVDTSYSVAAGSTKTDGAYVGYTGTTNTASYFNGGTTTPTGTARLNYSGYFYPTFLNLIGSSDTTTAATHYFVETGSDGFVRPKTLANVRTEIVGGFTGNFSTTALLYSTVSSTASNFKIPFLNTTGTASGNFGLLHDSAATFTYNPSTDTLAAGAATFTSSVTAAFLGIVDSSGQVGNINSTNANGGYITWQTSGTTIADLGTAQQIFAAGGNDTFGINARGARSLILGTNNTARLTIDSAGKVGIGTTNPVQKLHVEGNAAIGTTGTEDILLLGRALSGGVSFQQAASLKLGRYQNAGGSFESYTRLDIALRDNSTTSNYNTNTTVMTLTNAGYVGIGMTSPNRLLTIYGAIPVFQLVNPTTGTTANDGLLIYQNALDAFIENQEAGNLSFLTSGLSRMIIPSSGNVLIGTTSDNGAKLQVSGSVNIVGNGSQLLFDSLGSTKNGGIQYINDFVLNVYNSRGTGSSIQLGNTNLNLITNGNTRLTITDSGNVGIGTANATGQSADNRVIQIYGAGTGNRAQIHFVNSDSGETTTDGSFIGIDFSRELYIINRESAATVFENNGSERMRITSGGNVLIGTTSDNGNKLRVNGVGYFDNGVRTGQPVGTTTDNWLLGRALVAGTSTPDRWIRVQIGNLYYDILAVYMGIAPA